MLVLDAYILIGAVLGARVLSLLRKYADEEADMRIEGGGIEEGVATAVGMTAA